MTSTRTPLRLDPLLSPLELGDLTLANRVVMASLTRGRAGETMVANELMAKYYAQRASVGLLLSEGTSISPEGVGWFGAPGIWSDEQVEGWKPAVRAVHASDTPFFLQLWHTGRASHSEFHGGDLPVAPSAVRLEGGEVRTPSGETRDHEVPRALDTSEISRVVADYRNAAENAKKAGFDGVEIHAANGYLIDQFLQSKTNRRDDEYGGSVENRFRFLREILEACEGVFPTHRIGIKLSPNGAFNDMGSPDYRETFLFVAEQLEGRGLAYLQVVDGLGFGFHEEGEPMTLEDIRSVYTGRLMGNCGYTAESAQTRIADGHADLISFGRPLISNPDFVERLAHGWDFNAPAEQDTYYTPGADGYVDYPNYREADASNLDSASRA